MNWEPIARQIADEFRRQREEQIERLRNGIVDLVNQEQPPVEILIFVLRSIEHEAIAQANREALPAGTWREARAKGKPETLSLGE